MRKSTRAPLPIGSADVGLPAPGKDPHGRVPTRSYALPVMAAIFAAITLAINWTQFSAFWGSPAGGSFDGLSHLAIGEYYAKHIFPRTAGWAPHWFGGMPFPNFYPPLYYWLTAFLYRLLPFSYPAVVKLFLSALLLLLPGITAYAAFGQTRNRWAALSAGCLASIALSFADFPYGIGVEATLNEGLFTQLPGYVCLLLFSHAFLASDQNLATRLGAMLFLFLVLVFNVHIAPVVMAFLVAAATIAVMRSIRSRDYKSLAPALRQKLLLLFAPLTLAAFWYVPLLWHWQYVATMALPSLPGGDMAAVSGIQGVLTAIALFLSIREGNRAIQTTALTALLLLLATTIESGRLFPSLPIQPFRILASFMFLSAIPIGYLFSKLVGWLSNPPLRRLAFVLLIAPFAGDLWLGRTADGIPSYLLRGTDTSDAMRLSRQLSPAEGLTTVEVPSIPGVPAFLDDPAYLMLMHSLAAAGADSTYIAFREASISSIFMTPVRNAFSETAEVWGIESFLSLDPDFLSESLDRHLDLASFLGIDRFIVHSPRLRVALAVSPRVVREGPTGPWESYRLRRSPARARILEYEPAVFFGPVTFKKRSTWSYDYVRLQEEILFRGNLDVLVARASDPRLDTSPDLNRFKTLILTEYRYRDLDRAWNRLARYAENNTLLCVESADPLFGRLAGLARHSTRIHIFPRLHGAVEDIHPLRAQFGAILSALADGRREVPNAAAQTVTASRFADDRIAIGLSGETSEPLPVLITSSYFPSWRRSDSAEPIYMVTPTLMLTYARGSASLHFAAGAPVWTGLSISIAGLFVTAGLMFCGRLFPGN